MRRLERCARLVGAAAALAATTLAARADEPAYRYRAQIAIEAAAAFVQLPLPASAYGRSLVRGLADLRVVDARGQRVSFAVLAPRAPAAQNTEQLRDGVLYALPARPAADGVWASPIDITVQGERISVTRRSGAAPVAPGAASAGWLIDLGERARDEPPPQSLRLQWSGPAEFTAAFRIENSDDLRSWRPAGSGQLMALASANGPLTQPSVMLPAPAGRFVRLLWADPATAPQVSGVKVVAALPGSQTLDAPTELVFTPDLPPTGKTAPDADSARALHFDLGGVLPLVQVDLRLPAGTRIAPVRLQGRDDVDRPWRELGAAVFYRLERDGAPSLSPPLRLNAHARYLRVLPDARAATLDAAQIQLVVQAPLASLVFAMQGQPPFALLAGAAAAAPSALPAATLVPALDEERPRFGRASLGEWIEEPAAARAADRQRQLAALRPWLLWAVLLAGVAGLAFMVWRLTRKDTPRDAADA